MISLKLQIILVVGSVLSFLILLNLLRRYRLELKYSMLWIFIMIFVMILSLFPKMFTHVANTLGIEMPVNALFFLAIFGMIVILFSLTVEISRATLKIKELSQELGIMKHELKQINDSCNKD
ncbi:DUF2304 domain-containing protein [Paenibacillus illinoisensis]|uniref:DUF2304 domain-containing protein n=1 Tax=Paenibacillus illinoisensis TaxID=59845 RepID=A0A2W0CPN4_9BACL|nr:DUF2304 domain-containing protein [Paenibacillus illinoisensis]PYY29628.1 Uncharacterized protein PIL02S_02603 [Paenibacillus illinoisensis]